MGSVISRSTQKAPRALVVDDSQLARYVLSDTLERLGLDFEVADSAETAIQTLRATR